jgi:hypothetical protein
MRTILSITALATLACGSVSAATAAVGSDLRDNVGIGLGTMIFENIGDGLISQTFAATTNGSCGNQTFAITTGTSNAKKWKSIAMNDKVDGFVRDNMDVLARDMASGSGESLDALAELMAIPVTERPAFAASMQKNFGKIYSSPTVTHQQVIENIAKLAG